ncbi:MAG: glycosyltransferase 87 family protein [Candidatus Velamenicoccus archaeovorus]
MGRASERTVGLGLALVCLAATLGLGLAVKAPCASGDWSDARQYRRYCYSDVVPLLGTEQLQGDRLPYLDACATNGGECDEYPVLSMYAMRLAAWMSTGYAGFFYANALLLTIAAVVVTVCLYLLVGTRALYVALAPTLLVYGFVNWDLIAVALAAAATLAYLNRRDVWAGVLLGLGTAAKVYPGLLLIPFVLGRFRDRRPDDGIHLAWAGAGSWLAVNVPFILAAPRGWWEFFRFNSARPADWDSLWFIGCDRLTEHLGCAPGTIGTGAINAASAFLFVTLAVVVWTLKRRREPGFPRWTFGLPLLILFLLSNKVYSPQYGLWLLPWFALALPDLRLFAAFQAADVAVFLTRFSWFGRLSGVGGWPIGAFEGAVLVRDAILLICLVAWILRRGEPLEEAARPAAVPEAADLAA